MSRPRAPLPHREASFSSATSSRASSRASTPPTSSTPPRSYYLAAAAAPGTLLARLTITPSIATLLHYISLLLSIRLVVVSPRWTTFLLCLCLATTLEGRAKAERLGLRNTMRGVMTAVSVGVGWSNMATMMGGELVGAQIGGGAPGLSGCPDSSKPLISASKRRGEHGSWPNVTLTVCVQDVGDQLRGVVRDELADQLLDKTAAWIEGETSGNTPGDLCELAGEGLPVAGSFSIAIAAQSRDATKGVKAIDVTLKC